MVSGRHPTLIPLAVRRVEGAGEPSHLKHIVEVSGWTPVDTSVRIENPIRLIEKLGGWQLYGNDISAPFREALQNAADAVRARRRLLNGYENGAASAYPGRIDIRFECDPDDENLTDPQMIVADDGVGMSPDIMTGALLDFGRSFWDSTEAAEKYAGLLSDPLFEPTGKFGIGFYSIFMIANNVKVISRPWQAGLKETKVLHFQTGVAGRPELRDFNQDEDGYFPQKYSTMIIAKIAQPQLLHHFSSLAPGHWTSSVTSMEQFWKNLAHVFKGLVFALDVECLLSYGGELSERLNQPGVLELPAAEFAQKFNDTFSSPADFGQKGFVEEEIPLIDTISDKHGRVHTRGCIGSHNMIGLWHVGGFQCIGIVNSLIKGVRAGKALNASRQALSGVASKDELVQWGEAQLRKLAVSSIDPMFKLNGIATLSSIDVDVRRIAMVIADGTPRSIKDIVTELADRARIFVMGQQVLPRFNRAFFVLNPNQPFIGFDINDIKDLEHELRIWGVATPNRSPYFDILGSPDAPTNENSAYGALYKTLKDAGFRITTDAPG